MEISGPPMVRTIWELGSRDRVQTMNQVKAEAQQKLEAIVSLNEARSSKILADKQIELVRMHFRQTSSY